MSGVMDAGTEHERALPGPLLEPGLHGERAVDGRVHHSREGPGLKIPPCELEPIELQIALHREVAHRHQVSEVLEVRARELECGLAEQG
jgi:hypothetical protein